MFTRLSMQIFRRGTVNSISPSTFQFHFNQVQCCIRTISNNQNIPLFRSSSTLSGSGTIDIEDILDTWESNIKEDELTDDHKAIHHEHIKAVKNRAEMYLDPETGFEVFTILCHLRRGHCCGNACRHCPFSHANVAPKYRELKRFNSAFYI